MSHLVEREIGRLKLSIETGKMGKQASGSTVVRYGETIVFCAAVNGADKAGLGFFPLTMDYREKNYAAGKIPGGFFKREGRPTTKEILTMRLMDRPIRPLFPEGYTKEVAVSAIVISADKEHNPDILAMIGASASLAISEIPFMGPTGSVRIGIDKDGEFILNPTYAEIQSGPLDLIVSGTKDAITMIECGGVEVSEETILSGLKKAHEVIKEIVSMIEELQGLCGKEKIVFEAPEKPEDLHKEIKDQFGEEIKSAIQTQGKMNRKKAEHEIIDRVLEQYCPDDLPEDQEPDYDAGVVKEILECLLRDFEREIIAEGHRADGRAYDEIRQITPEVGVLPRTHGSSLFTRGETQALVVVTLGTELDEQRIDGLLDEQRDRFMLHYDFPSFCVGEAWPNRGPKRREIGHGSLARRALESVVPLNDDSFPYTLRVTSDILESNGSSSMATVCGGSLALMDAGVPLKRPVAGIAMGMIKQGDDVFILSDIQGSEDHNGDLDFKVAGTEEGITAMQLDCKVKGIDYDILEKALKQAKTGRFHILQEMAKALEIPRDYHSPYAPRVERFQINPEKIGLLIGPSGKTIRKIQEETLCTIAVVDEGKVSIWGTDQESTIKARKVIEELLEEAEIGKIYEGKVVAIKDFGCFVEIIPGQEGLVHVSELASGYIKHPSEVVSVGDKIRVKCINIDKMGKIKLSVKALVEKGSQSDGRGKRGSSTRNPSNVRNHHNSRSERPSGRGSSDRRPRHDRRS